MTNVNGFGDTFLCRDELLLYALIARKRTFDSSEGVRYVSRPDIVVV